MASFSTFLTTKKFPSRKTLHALLSGPLTPLSAAIYTLFIVLCATIFALLLTINNHYLVTVPARGGNLTEGVIGAPHYINPLLATTDTDRRLVSLVYATVTDMQQSYTVSPDGTVYTIALQPNLRFDDNKPLTSDDIAFTVEKMQDSTISANSDYWQNITVDTPDANTVIFTLPTSDTTFLSHLDFGVLPKHIWENVADESFETAKQNLHPVGAGVFKVSRVTYQNDIPTNVVLTRNNHSFMGQALLDSLTIATFANQSALSGAMTSGDIDFSYAFDPNVVNTVNFGPHTTVASVPTAETVNLYHSSADNVLNVQFNQIIDKNAIIATVLNGYGTPAGVPTNPSANAASMKTLPGFSLAVENDPSRLLAAQTLQQQLAQHGVTISVKAFDPGTFKNTVHTGTFSVFLAGSNDIVIPSQYSVALPLYATTLPYVFNTRTHTIISNTLESPETEYGDVKDWYTNTDKLWKWFIRKDYTK